VEWLVLIGCPLGVAVIAAVFGYLLRVRIEDDAAETAYDQGWADAAEAILRAQETAGSCPVSDVTVELERLPAGRHAAPTAWYEPVPAKLAHAVREQPVPAVTITDLMPGGQLAATAAILAHDHTPDPCDPTTCLHACRACLAEAEITEPPDPLRAAVRLEFERIRLDVLGGGS
jgi:hypothetical protein